MTPSVSPKRSRSRGQRSASGSPKRSRTEICPDLCVNTIRCLSADMVQKANSGHPGAPIGCAPIANALWGTIMNYSPKHPKWVNRDRFVLSNGHCCALLYSMLHLTGYELSIDDLKKFRQLGSKTPGHPENTHTAGVEVCTGPLGQGLTQAVGMCIAQAHLGARFNKPGFELFNNYTYVICGDGCMMEGVTGEASSLAGHLGLKNLIVFYDSNKISIDGSTDLAFTEDVGKRYESFGWHVLKIKNGDLSNPDVFIEATNAAKAQDKPTFVIVTTTIGYGSLKQGTAATHGAPLGNDDITQLKQKFGLAPEPFAVNPHVQAHFKKIGEEGEEKAKKWDALFASYAKEYPEEHKEIVRRIKGELPANWKDALPKYTPEDKAKATRQYSAEVLGALVSKIPEMIGGSADLTPSNLTKQGGLEDFQKGSYQNRYIRFGVREHAMCGISNGIFSYGMFRPFCATFLVFYGYAWGSTRLSSLSNFGVVYVGTHDSIDLGEDGPTHQPIELLPLMRSTPNMFTMRPADGNETSGAYAIAMESLETPTVLALSRSGTPNLEGSSCEKVANGAYVLSADNGAKVTLGGSGTEVAIIVEAAKRLRAEGVKCRVVSAPCWELFEKQPESYQKSVYPDGQFKVYVEASSTFGCSKYGDLCIGMETFGTSAPSKDAKRHFGFTADNVFNKTMEQVKKRNLK